MGQPVVHWELWSKDRKRIAAFYRDAFGWKIDAIPGLDYDMVDTGGAGGINGGIMTPQEGPWPGKLSFYIAVDDLDVFAAKVTSAGGKVIVEKQEVPGMGAFSLFEDPDGRVLGMWKVDAPR